MTSTLSFKGFGNRTRFGAGVLGAGFRILNVARSRTGTICATGVSRSRTAIVSPPRTTRKHSLSRDLSSAMRTCFTTVLWPEMVVYGKCSPITLQSRPLTCLWARPMMAVFEVLIASIPRPCRHDR